MRMNANAAGRPSSMVNQLCVMMPGWPSVRSGAPCSTLARRWRNCRQVDSPDHLDRIFATGDPLELLIRETAHPSYNDLERRAGMLCLESVTPSELTRPAPLEYPRGRLPLAIVGSRSDAIEQRGHRSSLRRFDLFGELGIIHPIVEGGSTDASRGRGQRDGQTIG